MPTRISRPDYAAMYGPTTGDRVRLGDADLLIEVERDLATYGEEVKFGGGKVIRDGMGQSQISGAGGGAVETDITNALILDLQHRPRHRNHRRRGQYPDRRLLCGAEVGENRFAIPRIRVKKSPPLP